MVEELDQIAVCHVAWDNMFIKDCMDPTVSSLETSLGAPNCLNESNDPLVEGALMCRDVIRKS